MKVDKAVCTDTYEDLSRAIRFEAVFSTLVENKILAIKRECELKKRNKKTKVIRRILFGRKICKKTIKNGIGERRARKVSEDEETDGEKVTGEGGIDSAGTGPDGELPLENSIISDGVDEVIVEIGDLSSLVDADGNVVAVGGECEADVYQSKSTSEEKSERFEASGERNGMTILDVDNDSGGAVGGATVDSLSKSDTVAQSTTTDDRKSTKSNDSRGGNKTDAPELASVSIEIEPHSDALSTQYDLEDSGTNVSIDLDASEISDIKRSIASEPVPIIKNASKYRQGSFLQQTLLGATTHRLRVLEAKSISAQNSPVLPRQKSTEVRHLTFSTATYQTTSSNPATTKSKKDIEDTSFVIDLSQDTDARNDDASITSDLSNCNSIVIPKNKQQTIDSKRCSHKKSALAIADSSSSSNASRSNKLNPAPPPGVGPDSSDRSHRHQQQKRFSDAVVYDLSPPPTPGLIESFNQLTAPNLPVITMRQSASPVSDMIKLHRLSAAGSGARANSFSAHSQTQQEFSSQFKPQLATTIISETSGRKQRHGFLRQSSCDVELHYRPIGDSATVYQQPDSRGQKHKSSRSQRHSFSNNRATTLTAAASSGARRDEWEDDPILMGELNESDEEKLNKRKYKYLKRCSDPVIVFPSTNIVGGGGGGPGSGGGFGSSGLQHCILSRPPNQPIQFPYDEDFMYDVSLQLESDRHGELDSIVPEHRRRHKHKHNHHRHCKKKRHKKRKILVHDLDDQSVKVIDPDDLPQRARWTIIATACLLLIMCLLLVGITLRMAPIIDDMVRQENERLMRESLDRAKMIKNYTEYHRMIGGDEIP
ncbi:uncharacterized protein LOC129768245 [Toxorhynchites rutilus septentrionalis]|uniref:uncharacterized protein LOC129768245 n=1 Tax=Toxorhynchites rutilus septentrionalis TaxID=329112 RepID=UPI0024791B8F|nr:uncharacterized protein LOC129768245 [Toxorhynchites rutilus septentrionalis]XP_055625724.1 uncharacterized protein LOC129768245 [Toxorhynchites rutilus septentrionalis]XP_055625725.1 uncharacterized protein LOC129768245 [Toxorhynchites rutilus septentrionalis]XP_055625726.1 uncharacterized protein LOC129768245 [Toxorhynchites rutilus septentrionalis]